jgi:hypothetical protein
MPVLASAFAALPLALANVESVVCAEAQIGHAPPSSVIPPPRAPPA